MADFLVKKLKNFPKAEFTFTPALPNDAGIDLYSAENITIPSHRHRVIKTGVAVKIPKGYFGKVFEKSGVSSKTGIGIKAGVIDADYTGEILLVVQNHSPDPLLIEKGEKLAQLVVLKLPSVQFKEVDTFEETLRGDAGFGSTN